MVGATLALGGVVAAAAIDHFGLSMSSAATGSSIDLASAGTRLGLIYALVAPAAACPGQGGDQEGTTLTLSLYNYGGAPFSPALLAVNGTIYPSSYAPLLPGTLGTYTIRLSACAHSRGQTLVVVGPAGAETQFES